jgi:sporulation protein YlmC with PRC-barrel domain
MKRILATSAAAIFASGTAFAGAPSGMFMSKPDTVHALGSELIGSYVYVSETEIEDNYVYEDDAEKEWDDDGRAERSEKRRMALNNERTSSDMDTLNAVKRDGYKAIEADTMKADNLIGTRVYGTKNEDVGEISNIIINPGKKTKAAVIDVGGFLGLGEKTVSVPMNELRIMREEEGDDLRVYIDATEERLENLPEYEDRG